MHGPMGGWYEIRVTGPAREQLRLFCLLETGTSDELARRGLPRPAIAVITGMRKPWRTVFSERDYQHVQELGREHQQNYPRRIAT
jgi:hypothetical protein